MSSLDTCFMEVSAQAFLKVATKSSFRGKKYRNLAFFGYFYDGKNGSVQPKNWSVCNRFGIIIIPCSHT